MPRPNPFTLHRLLSLRLAHFSVFVLVNRPPHPFLAPTAPRPRPSTLLHTPCPPSDNIPTSYFFTVQVRAVVRGLAAAQGVSTTLLPAVEALPASRLRIDSYPGIVYRAANASAVRIDATRAAAARARAQTDAIAAGLGARVGRLNFASLNADSFDGRSISGGRDSARSVFRASVRTEYYVR